MEGLLSTGPTPSSFATKTAVRDLFALGLEQIVLKKSEIYPKLEH